MFFHGFLIKTTAEERASNLLLSWTGWVLALLCVGMVFPCEAASSSDEKSGKTEPAAKVEISIKEKKATAGSKVEVKVSDKPEAKKSERSRKLEEVSTMMEEAREKKADRRHKVYQIGRKLSQKIDSWSDAARRHMGKWLPLMAFSGITWMKVAVSFLLLAFVFLLERVTSYWFQLRIRRIPEEQRGKVWRGTLVETLSKPLRLFLLAYGILFALSPLYVHFEDPDGSNVVYTVTSTAVEFVSTFAIVWFIYGLTTRLQRILTVRAEATGSDFDLALANLLGRTLRVFVILLGAFIILQNLTGLPLAPLLGSLGIGGFAIALAGKESISNFLGTVTIFLDRPFAVGDRIVLDKYDGFVEKVGFRSTRIRTFDGHLVAAPNEKIINSFVENIGQRPFIRWRTDIGIRHDTPPDKVERAVEILEQVLDRHEGMKEEMPARVYFEGLKNGCLSITIFAWYHPPEYWDYMAWVHRISVNYMRRFAQEGIEIAIPSRQVFLEEQMNADAGLDGH